MIEKLPLTTTVLHLAYGRCTIMSAGLLNVFGEATSRPGMRSLPRKGQKLRRWCRRCAMRDACWRTESEMIRWCSLKNLPDSEMFRYCGGREEYIVVVREVERSRTSKSSISIQFKQKKQQTSRSSSKQVYLQNNAISDSPRCRRSRCPGNTHCRRYLSIFPLFNIVH